MNKSREDEKYHAYWKNMVGLWQKTPIPIRPSFGDRALYREFLEKKGQCENILILGSTPELRDLAAQKGGAQIHVADFSRAMLAGMLRYTEIADKAKEVWVEENWLKLSLPKNSFDVILGDLVLQQVSPPFELELLGKIRSLLSDGGVFVGRFQFLDTGTATVKPDDIISRALIDPLPDDQKIVPLRMRLLWHCADPKKRAFDRIRAALLIDEFTKKHNIKSALLEHTMKNILDKGEIFRNWSPPDEATLTKLLLRHFRIIEKKHADDYEDALRFPVFVLGKRQQTTSRPRFSFHFAIWSRIRFMPRAFVRSWQLSELKKTIRLAHRNVHFYRTLWDKERIRPRDIRALRDLKRLPITSKRLFREQAVESVIHRSFPSRYVRWSETSG
ncbi:MAG: methyltransferase domain-containing protein [Patescibacteria group bacterium]